MVTAPKSAYLLFVSTTVGVKDLYPPAELSAGPHVFDVPEDSRVVRLPKPLLRLGPFPFGKPNKYYVYVYDISFPGTSNKAVKRMSGWQLQAEGVIKDVVSLRSQPVRSLELSISEGPSSRGPFKKISNVISGPVED
jgi:hypothetical protein